MSDNQENGSPNALEPRDEHLNIKVTDNNNEVFFKIKRSTKLEKLMNAFCERQGKTIQSVRFLFEGQRVQPTDTPDTVSSTPSCVFDASPKTAPRLHFSPPPQSPSRSSYIQSVMRILTSLLP